MNKNKSNLFKESKDYNKYFLWDNLITIEISLDRFNDYKKQGHDLDYMIDNEWASNKYNNKNQSYDQDCLVFKDIKISEGYVIIILENKGEYYA